MTPEQVAAACRQDADSILEGSDEQFAANALLEYRLRQAADTIERLAGKPAGWVVLERMFDGYPWSLIGRMCDSPQAALEAHEATVGTPRPYALKLARVVAEEETR